MEPAWTRRAASLLECLAVFHLQLALHASHYHEHPERHVRHERHDRLQRHVRDVAHVRYFIARRRCDNASTDAAGQNRRR